MNPEAKELFQLIQSEQSENAIIPKVEQILKKLNPNTLRDTVLTAQIEIYLPECHLRPMLNPLEAAVHFKKLKTIELLLNAGAKLDDSLAMWLAAKSSDLEMIYFLKSKGANIRPTKKFDRSPHSYPIHIATHPSVTADCLHVLLLRGADPEEANEEGRKPSEFVHTGEKANLLKTAQCLKNIKQKIQEEDNHGLIANLAQAITLNREFTTNFFKENILHDAVFFNAIEKAVANQATSQKSEQCLAFLKNLTQKHQQDLPESTPTEKLFELIESEKPENEIIGKIEKILRTAKLKNIKIALEDRLTIPYLSNKDHINLLEAAVRFQRRQTVKLLLEAGADLNTDSYALWIATRNSDLTMMNFLMAQGASVNYSGKHNNTYSSPVHMAMHPNVAKDCLHLLLLKGADPEQVNNEEKKPSELTDTTEKRNLLEAAIHLKNITQKLRKGNTRDLTADIAHAIKLNHEFTIDFFKENILHDTVFFNAIKKTVEDQVASPGDREQCLVFFKNLTQKNEKNLEKCDSTKNLFELIKSVELPEDEIIDAIEKFLKTISSYHMKTTILRERFELIHEHNADDVYVTLLEAAVRFNRFKTIQLFLNAGAKLDESRALWFATRGSNLEMMNFLIAQGANIRPTRKVYLINFPYPIHIANHREVTIESLRLLLLKGADPEHVNDEGKKPIELADTTEKRNLLETATCLKNITQKFEIENVFDLTIDLLKAIGLNPDFTIDFLKEHVSRNTKFVNGAIAILSNQVSDKTQKRLNRLSSLIQEHEFNLAKAAATEKLFTLIQETFHPASVVLASAAPDVSRAELVTLAQTRFETENYTKVLSILESAHAPSSEVTKAIDTDGAGRPIQLNLLSAAVQFGKWGIADFLLAKGMSADSNNNNTSITPLFIATKKGDLEMMKLLIGYGANIDLPTIPADTRYPCPIHIATLEASISYAEPIRQIKKDCLRLLLLSGANLESSNDKAETPIKLTTSTEIKNLLNAASCLRQSLNAFESDNIAYAKALILDALKADSSFTFDYLHQTLDNKQPAFVETAVTILQPIVGLAPQYAIPFQKLMARIQPEDLAQEKLIVTSNKHKEPSAQAVTKSSPLYASLPLPTSDAKPAELSTEVITIKILITRMKQKPNFSEIKPEMEKMLKQNFVATMVALDYLANTQTSFVRLVFLNCKDTIEPLFKKAQLEQSVRQGLEIFLRDNYEPQPTPQAPQMNK